MKSAAIFAVFIGLLLGIYLLIRHDFEGHYKLTKKGYTKLLIAMAVITIVIMVTVYMIESMQF
ncbi:hypothetical protein ACFFIS_04290 [Virgibacillus soli]|uniref:DUF3976 domain-containing protein n=1 Tax=Paracerasibacillus soli TaxID=480284 RepID=A0ABU5CTA9_9BACI|nr:hypothetical protein [Virgibacillus soli]MDY0409561.1 hypothetical protein [Virgibacillus soli]